MTGLREAIEAIEAHGVLFVQDATLPSLATLIAGEPVRGSWWGHPAAHRIFAIYGELEDHADVARVKLLDRKVCLVHRALFAPLSTVGCAAEPWQLQGLEATARALLVRVQGEGRVRATGPPAKELEHRLLAVGEQVHSESGRHVTELWSWDAWAAARGVSRRRRSVPRARAALERCVDALASHGRRPRLPWESARARPR